MYTEKLENHCTELLNIIKQKNMSHHPKVLFQSFFLNKKLKDYLKLFAIDRNIYDKNLKSKTKFKISDSKVHLC